MLLPIRKVITLGCGSVSRTEMLNAPGDLKSRVASSLFSRKDTVGAVLSIIIKLAFFTVKEISPLSPAV